MFKQVTAYMITYSNDKHEYLSVTVYDRDSMNSWTDRLDDRIARGTCGGYLVTQFNTWIRK